MPFTPSHAIVALPFIRTPLVPGAIAVGAMAPDLPLFVNVGLIDYGVLHDLRALAVSTALALVLFLAWRLVLRPAVRQLVPTALARRLPSGWDAGPAATLRETFVGARGWVLSTTVLLLSLALGVVTHVLWDAFTHEGRAGVTLLPILDEMWGPLLGYKWVQYGSGVLGILVLAGWGALRLRRAPIEPVRRVVPAWVGWGWLAALPTLMLVAWAYGYATWGPFTQDYTVRHLAYDTLPQACGVWGALTLALCLAVAMVRSRQQTSGRSVAEAEG